MPDILIIPNRSFNTGIPTMNFVGANASGIALQVLENGSVAFIGNAGSLFSINDSLTGLLTSVNNIAGLPILEVYDSDKVVMGAFNSNALVVSGSGVALGTDFVYPNQRLFVSGDSRFEGHLWSGEQNLANIYYPRTNPSGYITGFDLYQSGVVLNAKIDSLSGFVLLASGGLEARIRASGQQAWTHGQNNATNISGRLTATGQTILSILSGASGILQTQINALPSIAYTNNIGINLSGALTQTGINLVARDNAISGALQAQINELLTAGYVNGMGSILSGNLTQTGIALLNTIINTGNNAVAHANGIGTNLTGLVIEMFLAIDNRIVDLSGYSNSTFATIDTANLISGKINSLSGWAAPANANYVYTTGIQIISGAKTFASELFTISGIDTSNTLIQLLRSSNAGSSNNITIALYNSNIPTNSSGWNIRTNQNEALLHISPLTNQYAFVIHSGGNVGINTPLPQSKLHLTDGDFRITDGNIISGNSNLFDIYYPRTNPSGYVGNVASISESIVNSGDGFNRLNLNCSGTNYQISTLTGNTIISGINYAPGLSVTARIFAAGTERQLMFPSTWRFLGSVAPASLVTGKVGVLTLTSFTNVDSGVVAAYAVEA